MIPVEEDDGIQTARISCDTSLFQNEFDGDSPVPQLKPEDLEEMAATFDKIRLLNKKRDDGQTPIPKKLITKSIVNKVDELAVEFDTKLTDTMLTLSKSLKDQALSNSQKWAEIEKCKFKLQSFCCETAIRFLQKEKITQKEQKDLHQILSKLRYGMSKTFDNQISLFYSKEEKEV
jgi:phage gp36-like protein